MTKRDDLLKIEKSLKEIDTRKQFNALSFYKPYDPQKQFHDLGQEFDERLFMAGNRVGKSYCGANEMAIHLTGRYPKWWAGRRFDRPIKAWACSDTSITTRDIVQSKLCGKYGQVALQGSGTIPRECVDWSDGVSLARGVTDAYDTVNVKHESGGYSVLTFKSYEQGRKKFQGDAIDVIWDDEEPPMDIYGEQVARLAPTRAGDRRGTIFITFTPLLGMSEVVRRFVEPTPPTDGSIPPKVVYVQMSLDEAKHIDPEEREKQIASYPEHERDARRYGVPLLGSGRIFPYSDIQVAIDDFAIPLH